MTTESKLLSAMILTSVLTTIIMVIGLTFVSCKSMAETFENYVPDVVKPEVYDVDLNMKDGSVAECKAVYVHLGFSDVSELTWIWAAEGSDPRCEPEMERLAKGHKATQ